ncbi:M48 family metallopeptidase [Flavobacterium sp. j3]|uniref:M48 family metallopeptidase n=1 Tax=Flavobacterium aureirubrum TaxID=3133147 RepID=A0ABU9N5G0_9FLAO
MRFFCCILFFYLTSIGHSQILKLDYSPSNKDSLVKYVADISEKKIKKLAPKTKEDIKKIILERKTEFIKNLNDSSFIFNKQISNYLTSILNEIYVSNRNIDKNDFYFFIDKSPIPNAACYGNGIFTVNLGLFNFVNSDDELAFILCHEIAHYMLEHNDKSLLNYLTTINSKENKKKFSQLRRQEYGRRKAYSEMMEKLNYNFLRRGRTAEIQADSLGYLMFKNTKFNKKASVQALQNLNLSDDIVFNEDSKIKNHFNFDNYPFKEAWLLKEETLFDINSKVDDYLLNKDSLKTHPDMPFRIEMLGKLIQGKDIDSKASGQKLSEIKKLVALLSISNFLDENRIDFALYKTLVLYNNNVVDQKTYSLVIGSLLKAVYELKSNHSFGKYVSQLSPFSEEENLNQVKLFLNNIELKNIKKIGFNFCLQHEQAMKNNDNFKSILDFFTNLNNKNN